MARAAPRTPAAAPRAAPARGPGIIVTVTRPSARTRNAGRTSAVLWRHRDGCYRDGGRDRAGVGARASRRRGVGGCHGHVTVTVPGSPSV